MRDAHRMKEKYDLSLDNRQIGSLLIGGIVVLGAVFVLGVVVGKKLGASERAQSAPDLMSALDRADAAVRVSDESLTFPDELTKKVDPPRESPSAKKPEPPKEPPKPEPKKADDGEKALAEATEDPAPHPDGKVEEAAVPTRTSNKDAGLKEAIARATAKPETAPNGPYTLQLSASQSKEEADSFAQHLRDKGYAPYIIQAQVPGRGLWYRVRMGSFASKDAANRYLVDFKRETQIEAFVASNEDKK
jgi:DedD protein